MLAWLRRGGPEGRIRELLLLVAILGGAFVLLRAAQPHYPLQDWLFWRYAGYWTLSLVWALGCVSSGHALLRKLLGRVLPVREQLTLSFAAGLFVFFLATFLVGLAGGLGVFYFVATPLAMVAAGALPTWRTARRLARHIAAARRRPTRRRVWWSLPVLAYGLYCFGLLYFNSMLPINAGFDAHWYHLPIAEHYVASGGVVRFPEGWVMGTYPQLTSLVYAWAFLLPVGKLFDRIELAAHLEVVIFAFTLASIPALVRRLVPGCRAPLAWVALFLFPGIFIYDSNLNVAADHVAAFWAVPIYLALLRVWPSLGWRESTLLALMLAGAACTKYTALALLGFPVLAYVARTVQWTVRAARVRAPSASRRWWLGPIAAGGGTLLFTTPHWLKNWLWYGDPFYPQLRDHLTLRPWNSDAVVPFLRDVAMPWHPERTWYGLQQGIDSLHRYAFLPHNWKDFHGDTPVFGFLFTLSVAWLILLRKTKRLWGLYAAGHVAVFIWFMTLHLDRYLQTFVPWMAAGVAAALVLVWQEAVWLRVAAAGLVLLQVIWGADFYFYPTHRMMHGNAARSTIDLLSNGYWKKYDERLELLPDREALSAELPEGAVLLIHERRDVLGITARRVTDRPGNQGAISYGRERSPASVFAMLRGFGVTHVAWQTSEAFDSVTGDLIFYDFALRRTGERKSHGGWFLGTMPAEAPPDVPYAQRTVTLLTCNDVFEPGTYTMSDLAISPFAGTPKEELPKPRERVGGNTAEEDLMRRADFVVHDATCHAAMPTSVRDKLVLLGKRNVTTMWVRSSNP